MLQTLVPVLRQTPLRLWTSRGSKTAETLPFGTCYGTQRTPASLSRGGALSSTRTAPSGRNSACTDSACNLPPRGPWLIYKCQASHPTSHRPRDCQIQPPADTGRSICRMYSRALAPSYHSVYQVGDCHLRLEERLHLHLRLRHLAHWELFCHRLRSSTKSLAGWY